MGRVVYLVMVLLLTACFAGDEQTLVASSPVTVASRMGAAPDPGFKRVTEPRVFEFPQDHGAHPDFATEWWYFTGNLNDRRGQRLGYQLTLFRVGLKPGEPAEDSTWRAHQLYMGHLAVTHVGRGEHLSSERFSRAAMGLAGSQTVPFKVWLGDWTIYADAASDIFPLRLRASDERIAIDLTLEKPGKPMLLQGDRGYSRKGDGEGNASYYYSYTRLPSSGRIRFDEEEVEVEGASWFDREWSSSALSPNQAGWDWMALQLDDGRDLMFYRMRDFQGRAQPFSKGVLVDREGGSRRLDLQNTRIEPIRFWTNDQGDRYPVGWRLLSEQEGLELEIDAVIDDQQMDHAVRYWEGAVDVRGSVGGVGYLELSGYQR
jgi:predicted secreted hydrolase